MPENQARSIRVFHVRTTNPAAGRRRFHRVPPPDAADLVQYDTDMLQDAADHL